MQVGESGYVQCEAAIAEVVAKDVHTLQTDLAFFGVQVHASGGQLLYEYQCVMATFCSRLTDVLPGYFWSVLLFIVATH